MPLKINPIRLLGARQEGYALDLRTITSTFSGTVADFLRGWNIGIDALVPVPPSNTARRVQPVAEISRRVCERAGIALCDICIPRRSGATVTAITNLLASEGHAAAVFLLTLTRTRSRS